MLPGFDDRFFVNGSRCLLAQVSVLCLPSLDLTAVLRCAKFSVAQLIASNSGVCNRKPGRAFY
ncbi:MAG: hypothetical protein AAB316_03530, partial [Bacteroidota bacterium]